MAAGQDSSGAGVGVVSRAVNILREHADDASPRLLREALLEACGAHRHAHPIAYWERHQLAQALAEAHDLIRAELSLDVHPERWANATSAVEVADGLERIEDDIAPPGGLTLRPWSDEANYPKDATVPLGRFRFPFVATGATLADMDRQGDLAVKEWLDLRDIPADVTSFDLLDRMDGLVGRDDVEDPVRIARATLEAHERMRPKDKVGDEVFNLTSQWLHGLVVDRPDIRTEELTWPSRESPREDDR